MGWFEDQGIDAAVQPDRQIADAPAQAPAAAPGGGGDKAWLDWINATYGKSSSRGTGFSDLPKGVSLEQAIGRFNQETGAGAKYIGGPSGDRVDFGQGVTDALTAGGQLWSDYGAMSGQPREGASAPGGGGGGGYGGYGGGGGSGSASTQTRTAGPPVVMPTAPTVQDLKAPDPFSYQGLGNLATFTAPSQTPTAEKLSYNAMATPTAFKGDRQADPGTLSYENLATPEGYTPEKYAGLTEEQLKADPSYQFRLKTQQDAFENSAASKGVLRTGNSARGLMDLSGQLASQEYAAADQRARATNQMNNATSLGAYQTNAQTGLSYDQNRNANALNFGQANIQNAFNANQANYGRASAEDQQGFSNQFAVNQANNQGQNAATQANNQNALQAQAQQYGQALGGYQANLAGQQQGYTQAAGTYGMNSQNALAYNQNANQNALANYQAQTNAALGLGNLNLGYQNSSNSYNLGQQGLGLQAQGQAFNQGLSTYDRNYQANVTDPWAQQMGLANLGNPGAPNGQGYANAQTDLITGQGNANAAGQVGAANAYGRLPGQFGQAGLVAAEYMGPAPSYGYPPNQYSGYPAPIPGQGNT